MEYFNRLGHYISEQWRLVDCHEESFPEVATHALTKMPPVEYVNLVDIFRWALSAETLPHQTDLAAKFGQPPLTVFQGRDFRIEVLHWVTGVPEIHEHAFSGAFHVLHGSSIQSEWEFSPEVDYGARLRIGQLTSRRVELLPTGSTRAIHAGSKLIHSTFHLERPSVTVVVRTISEANHLPQYGYLYPSIAFDEGGDIPIVRRRTQLLQMLWKSGLRSEYRSFLRQVIEKEDPYSLFHYIRGMWVMLDDEDEKHDLLLRMSTRYPPLCQALRLTLESEDRAFKIRDLRKKIVDRHVQLWLALLLNVPDRDGIYQLLRAVTGTTDPACVVLDALRIVSRHADTGVRVDDISLFIIEGLLRSKGTAQISAELTASRLMRQDLDVDKLIANTLSELSRSWLLQKHFGHSVVNRLKSSNTAPHFTVAEQ